ncbi:hypothetical protein GCM10027445_47860 [Amycolatopsis endophytica]|uniref:Uncharacterized protein n=1 Tax=Amycolatopsis endophytica TaxID=860233 RepID=A0A853AY77_9PSEU|nr:hypothetical protein [Amycolatopsis endophytica]NYI87668.1 hypothetical protein [Amycolatopsis endophytica]
MQVIHLDDHVWTLTRGFAPWKSLVQPMNIAPGEYHRYRALPADPRRTTAEWRKERREQRKTGRQDRGTSGWHWLCLAPLLLVVGLAGQIVKRSSSARRSCCGSCWCRSRCWRCSRRCCAGS